MNVSVFGLGYVGSVSAACLARDGHKVIGVDVDSNKVAMTNSGRAPVLEPGLEKILAAVVRDGRLRATTDSRAAIQETDISLICVGTPSNPNGSLNLRYLDRVCIQLGTALAAKRDYHLVVVRSTVLPGTVEGRVRLLLEQHSDRTAGDDFGLCMNPEFLREGTAIEDYDHPSVVVVGELDPISGDLARRLYETVNATVVRTSIPTAEMLKYVNNAFHALKVAFTNEVGNLCAAHGIDGHEVMEHFCLDRRLNISSAYLKPGFAFGGSCLPKDLRALVYRAKEQDLDCPLLGAVLPSNYQQIRRAIELVERTHRRRIGILGLSFKAGTDDIRESPVVHLVEALVGKGYRVKVFDEKLDLGRLTGSNKSFLEQELPHIASLLCPSLPDLVTQCDVIVIGNNDKAFRQVPALLLDGQILIDLVGVTRDTPYPLFGPAQILEERAACEGVCK